jgi:hypothetical protein
MENTTQNGPQRGLPPLDGILESVSLVRIDRWSDKIQLVPQLEKFAVVSALNHLHQGSLHRADVLPGIDWAGTGLNSVSQASFAEPVRSGGESNAQLKSIPAEVEVGDQLQSDQLDSLMAGLCHREVELVVGLDADKWPVRKHLPFESQLLLKIVGCFTATQPLNDVNSLLDSVGPLEGIRDGFNHPVHCELLQVKQLPELLMLPA